MNNLPLQPLVWFDYGNGTASESRSALHEYDAWKTGDNTGWVVGYFDRRNPDGIKEATGFSTMDEAKEWCWNHYNEKMQPYVKPMPTWIDVSERLPEEDGLYLALRKGFTFEMGNASDLVPKVSGWNGGRGCFDDDYGNVLITHWMPIPEFSTMQNLHKEE